MHRILLILVAVSSGLRGQGDSLEARVETALMAADENEAAAARAALVADPSISDGALLAAVRRAPRRSPGASFELRVPDRGRHLVARVELPEALEVGARPPVLLDVFHGSLLEGLGLEGVVRVSVSGYTPPQFSDEGRDGFLRVLRLAAWAAGGDRGRLWSTGYSWAAHACYDNALHRPGVLRGIASLGGGPRRVHWRLMPNLEGLCVRAFCGAEEDPELVWNLEELERTSRRVGFDHALVIDPRRGHQPDLRGRETVGRTILDTPAGPSGMPSAGRLLADGDLVASPWLRVEEVDPAKVALPKRIPVSARLSPDAQRRKTLEAMSKAVARIDWRRVEREDGVELVIRGAGVRRATLLLREGDLEPGRVLRVRVGRKVVHEEALEIDRRALLEEARRDGDRLLPAIFRLPLEF